MPAARVRVSIVLPTRDKAPRLRMTLSCLAGQCAAGEVEVVVVDDGSRDETRDVLSSAARDLPLTVVPGSQAGRAAARNTGAARASGEYLIFLDDDVLVGPGFVAAHLALAAPDRFVHGRTRELVAAERIVAEVAWGSPEPIRRLRDELHVVPADRGADRRYRLYANALERTVEAMAEGTLPDVAPWLGFVGANVSMPRAALRAVGGFDEGFGQVWGCEDLELGLRLHHAGVRRWLAPEALGVHLTHRRPGRWEEHAVSLDRFRRLHHVPSVTEIGVLLTEGGDPSRYVSAVLANTSAERA